MPREQLISVRAADDLADRMREIDSQGGAQRRLARLRRALPTVLECWTSGFAD